MAVAVLRDAHRTYDRQPWVLDDSFALVLVGPGWRDIRAGQNATYGEDARRQQRAGIVVRSRYAEDRLGSSGNRQYVVLGAGLDSFAWRRPDVLESVRLFEVDHPATQAAKRDRAEELGLPTHHNHVFAPVDFEAETVREGLTRAGLDWVQPVFFSWLGVTMYLTHDAIAATLSTVAACASGSEIAFSYVPDRALLDEVGQDVLKTSSRRWPRQQGNP